jgi:hypothetical protein
MSTYDKNPKAVSRLSPEKFRVTQRNGTEQPFANAYWDNHEPGIYVDVVSGEPLFASAGNQEMLRADLESENETIRNYLERVKQCELLSEYATAETIREILIDEQDHQIALATALGIGVPRVGMEGRGQ